MGATCGKVVTPDEGGNDYQNLAVNQTVAIIPRRSRDNSWFIDQVGDATRLSGYDVFKVDGVDILSQADFDNAISVYGGSNPNIIYELSSGKDQALVELKFKHTGTSDLDIYDFDKIEVLNGDVLVNPDLTVVFKLKKP